MWAEKGQDRAHRWYRPLLRTQSLHLILEIADASTLVVERHDVAACCGVVPLEATFTPLYVQSEHLAAPLYGVLG